MEPFRALAYENNKYCIILLMDKMKQRCFYDVMPNPIPGTVHSMSIVLQNFDDSQMSNDFR